MSDFYIKQGDTSPAIKAELTGEFDNLDSVSSVYFNMTHVENQDNVINRVSGVVSDSENRIVRYSWDDGDTDLVGEHVAEFELEYSNGKTETFPNYGDIEVYVSDEVA